MKSLDVAYAAKRAAKNKRNKESLDQNFLSDEMENVEAEESNLFDNPNEGPDDSEDTSGGLLEAIMKKVRKKQLGV